MRERAATAVEWIRLNPIFFQNAAEASGVWSCSVGIYLVDCRLLVISKHNGLLGMDPQPKAVASRHGLRARQRQRYSTEQ